MTKRSVSFEQEGSDHESSEFTIHEFAQKHQFIMGVLFSLMAMAVACGIIGLIAALPHSNTPFGSTNTTVDKYFDAFALPLPAQTNDAGFIPEMKAPLPVGRSVVETFWPGETRPSGYQPIEP